MSRENARQAVKIDVSGAHRFGCEVGDHPCPAVVTYFGDIVIRGLIQREMNCCGAGDGQYGLCLVVRYG